MTFIEHLVQSLDVRVEELHGEIASLTRTREGLVTEGATPPPSPAKTRRPARRRDRPRTTRSFTEIIPAGKLHKLLANSDGMSTASLAERANAEPAQVLPVLREMKAAGSVRRSGHRRGTRWQAVASEEEWIAHRAAELADRSRNG